MKNKEDLPICSHLNNGFCLKAEEICRQSAKPGERFNPVLPSLNRTAKPVNFPDHFQLFTGIFCTEAKNPERQQSCSMFTHK